MPLRPCGTCRQPVPDGRCPRHPRIHPYRPGRPSVVTGAYDHTWQRIRRAVLNRDGWTCRYCHGRAGTADHVIPHSRGGTRSGTNLLSACRRCNTSKGNRTLAEWCATGLAPQPAHALLVERTRLGLAS